MDRNQQLRATIVSTILRDMPKGFWEDARVRTRQAYLDIYHQIAAEPNALEEQKLDMLYQARHFRMENTLAVLAYDHGLAFSPTMLVENNRHYVYATKGSIGLTQAYVPAIGALPQPAKFRERHAALNNIPRMPRLNLGDEPEEILLIKDFYGLIVHNPAGKRFNEEDQRLGMLQFCVPTDDCKEWAVQLAMEEIISEYPVKKLAPKPERKPEWKKRGDKKSEGAA